MKRFALGVLLVFVSIGVALAIAASIALTPERLERSLSNALGRSVRIAGSVDVSFWGVPRVRVADLRVENPRGSDFNQLASVDTATVSLRWWDLPRLLGPKPPHFLDVEIRGGWFHVDGRQDVVGDDGEWPSADDPFTGMLGWLNTLHGHDLGLEVRTGDERAPEVQIKNLRVSFDTGVDGAVIIDAEAFALSVDDLEAGGAVALNAPIVRSGSEVPAVLTGRLDIVALEMASLFGELNSTGGNPGELDSPIPVRDCRAWDVDLDVSLGSLHFHGGEVAAIRLDLTSAEGLWKIGVVNADFSAGHGDGEISLDCGRLPARFAVRSRVASTGKSQFSGSGAEVKVLGRMESELKLESQGSTWADLRDDLSGRFVTFLGPVRTENLQDRLYAQDLFHALTVSWGQSEQAIVDCAVLDMPIENAVGNIRQVIIGTPTLVIDGSGQVDLVKDRLDIVLIPRARHPRLLDLHPPLRISGPIQAPRFGLNWPDLLPRLGLEAIQAVVETFLNSIPLSYLQQEERDACLRSLRSLDVPGEEVSMGPLEGFKEGA